MYSACGASCTLYRYLRSSTWLSLVHGSAFYVNSTTRSVGFREGALATMNHAPRHHTAQRDPPLRIRAARGLPSPRIRAPLQCAARDQPRLLRAPRIRAARGLPSPRLRRALRPRARRHCQRPKLVKGKSPQGPRIPVQIEQYLLCSAAQLKSCSSPAAAASRLTSSIPSNVSLLCRRRKPTVEICVDNTAKLRLQAPDLALRATGANQLLKPASTTPRS
jgi:hypothetical protein